MKKYFFNIKPIYEKFFILIEIIWKSRWQYTQTKIHTESVYYLYTLYLNTRIIKSQLFYKLGYFPFNHVQQMCCDLLTPIMTKKKIIYWKRTSRLSTASDPTLNQFPSYIQHPRYFQNLKPENVFLFYFFRSIVSLAVVTSRIMWRS